jgi:hypothetical protein
VVRATAYPNEARTKFHRAVVDLFARANRPSALVSGGRFTLRLRVVANVAQRYQV